MDFTSFSKRISATREASHIPGLAAALLRHDALTAQTAVGDRRLGHPQPVTLQDYFHIGSCGKAMTAAALAILQEDGLLDWSTTLPAAFPELADEMHPQYRAVTLLQLLTHQAGLPPFEEDEEFADLPPFAGDGRDQRRAFARLLLLRQPDFPPGSEHRYSNAGYGIAAAAAEGLSGRSWEQLLQQELFTPLQMNAGFGWPAAADPDQPWGHCWEDGRLQPHSPHDAYQLEPIIAPAGDIWVQFDQYPRFLQLHLRGLRGETTLLRPETVRFIHTRHGTAGLGWGVQELLGHRVSVHTGSADTFFTIALLAPDIDLGIIIAANAFTPTIEKGCIDLLKELLTAHS